MVFGFHRTWWRGSRRLSILRLALGLAAAVLAAQPALAGKPGITLSVPGVAKKGDIIKVKVGVAGPSEGIWFHTSGLSLVRGYFDHCGWCNKPCLVNDTIQQCPSPPDGCCFNYYCLTCQWSQGHEFSDTWYGGPTLEYEVTGCDTATIQPEYYGGSHEGPFTGEKREIMIVDGIEASLAPESVVACTDEEVFFDNTSCGGTTFHWSFGDGATATGERVSHSWDTPGVYTVTLTAQSSYDSDQATGTVTVVENCATFKGTITDAVDGHPLPGATVAAVGDQHNMAGRSFTGGAYSFKVPANETYSVTAHREGYVPTPPGLVTPAPNEVVTMDFALDPVDQDPVDPMADLGPQWNQADDPVNPATGNFTFTRTLFSFPGKAGLPLVFRVSYNSLDGGRVRSLGHGWTHSFDVYMTWSGTDYTLYLPDGSRRFFRKDSGTGEYVPFNCHAVGVLEDRSPSGWTYTLPRGVQYELDAQGRLERIVDSHGNAITLSYSTQLDRITDTAGRQVDLHSTGGRLTSITSPFSGGDTATFTYDANGDLTGITDARGGSWSFTYDAQHRMLTETDRRGVLVLTNSYDAQGRVVRQTDALGHDTTYSYTEVGGGRLKVVITPPSGHAVTQVYDAAHHLLRDTDGAGHTATFAYGANGMPASLTDKLGNVTTMGFDDRGNLLSLTDRLGGKVQMTYDANGFLNGITDQLGNATLSPTDSQGNLYNISLPDNNLFRFVANAQGLNTYMEDLDDVPWNLDRDGQGQITRVSGRDGYDVSYHHDAAGRVVQIDLPAGIGSIRYSYDSGGLLSSVTSPGGSVISFTHDAEGNTTSRTFEPTGATTTYAYDDLGRLHTVTDAMGGVTTYAYDADSNLVAVTDGDGVTVHYGYDARNARVTVTSPSGAVTSTTYDADGRRTAITDALGNTWSFGYDAEGRLMAVTDPLGNTARRILSPDEKTITTVDPLGRETVMKTNAMGDLQTTILPSGDTIERHWNAKGQPFGVTNALGKSWTYSYNGVDRLVGITGPDGAREEYGYDALGRRTGLRRPGSDLITYDYDADSRLAAVHLPDGSDITYGYAYDATGLTTTITGPEGTTELHQDLLGRFDRKTDPFGNTVRITYTPGGRMASVIYPGNHVVQYAYDTAGRLDRVTDWLGHVTRYHYDGMDRVSRIDFPNGTSTTYAYDATGRLTGLTHSSGGTTLISYAITRDPLGKVASMTVTGAAAATPPEGRREASYDDANHVVATVKDLVPTQFTFDADGRQVAKKTGNVTTTYSYDALNRLLQVTDGTHTTTYTVDWEGSRIRVVHDGAETRYLRRGNQLWAALDGANNPQRYYIAAGKILYSLDAGGALRVYHTDPQGSVVAVTDGGGAVAASFVYDPYGRVLASTGSSELRYLGGLGVLADANGLYETGIRMYDPESRRFLTPDPLGLEASLNLYAYTEGDPVNTADPRGTTVHDSLKWAIETFLYEGDNLNLRDPGAFFPSEPVDVFGTEVSWKNVMNYLYRNFGGLKGALRTLRRLGFKEYNMNLGLPKWLQGLSEEERAEVELLLNIGKEEAVAGAEVVAEEASTWLDRLYEGLAHGGRQVLLQLTLEYYYYQHMLTMDAVEALAADPVTLPVIVSTFAYGLERFYVSRSAFWYGWDVEGHWMTGDEIVSRYFLPGQLAAWQPGEDPDLWFRKFLRDAGLSYDDYLKIAASVGP